MKAAYKIQVYKQWLAFPTRKKTHSQAVFGQLVSCPTAIGQSPNHVKDIQYIIEHPVSTTQLGHGTKCRHSIFRAGERQLIPESNSSYIASHIKTADR